MDAFHPTSVEDLAVNKKKIDEVDFWLQHAIKSKVNTHAKLLKFNNLYQFFLSIVKSSNVTVNWTFRCW